jgi:S-formylglutathione hydrolase FrmB
MRTSFLFIIALFGCSLTNVYKQSGTVTTQSITSSILNKKVAYNVYLPPSYSQDTTVKYPVLYLLHGLLGNNTDWTNNAGLVATMSKEIANGAKEMIIIMPHGLDAFYCNNYDARKLRYEDFMVQELIPQLESKYRIISSKGTRAIAGLSMGGYGATYHAFKFREMYSSCYSMSGALILGATAPNIETLLDSLSAEQLNSLPPFIMEVGIQDSLVYTMNVNFHNFLLTKNIDHKYIARDGVHDWAFWTACLPKAIRFASENYDSIQTNASSIDDMNVEVYPNPSIDLVHVKAGSAKFVTLYDIKGNLLDIKIVKNSEVSFYVGDLAKGPYMISIEQKNKTEVFKIIVN